MKKILGIIFILLFTGQLYSAMPSEITYRGILKEYGAAVTGTRDIKILLYDKEDKTTPIWSQEFKAQNVANGVFRCVLEPVGIDWSGAEYWIETMVNDRTLTPRNKITADAYALHSETAEGLRKEAGETISFKIGNTEPLSITSSQLTINGDIESTGTIKAVKFMGDGSALTGIITDEIDAEDITSGILSDLRLSTSVTKLGDMIEGSEITNGTITNDDINAAAMIAWSKIDKTGAIAGDVGAISSVTIAADDFTQAEVDNLRTGKLDDGTTPWTDADNINTGTINNNLLDTDLQSLANGSTPWTNADNLTEGTVANARLDADLQDLADGTLSSSKIQNGEYMIDSAGTSGSVWTSDGSGKGNWQNGNGPDYDSGWFTTSGITQYTLSHGLTNPIFNRLEIVWRADSSSTMYYPISFQGDDSMWGGAQLRYDGSSIYVRAGGGSWGYAYNGTSNIVLTNGDIRIFAWKN
ncbi:MAG: hypothetical protein ABH857_01800 [Elusimicrobiota bacterium]